MKNPYGLVFARARENELDALYAAQTDDSPPQDREYYRQLMMSTCLRMDFDLKFVYYQEDPEFYICPRCWTKDDLKNYPDLVQDTDCHLLLARRAFVPTPCSRCQRDVLRPRRTLQCPDCQNAYKTFKEMCEEGVPIHVAKFEPLLGPLSDDENVGGKRDESDIKETEDNNETESDVEITNENNSQET